MIPDLSNKVSYPININLGIPKYKTRLVSLFESSHPERYRHRISKKSETAPSAVCLKSKMQRFELEVGFSCFDFA